MRHLSRQSIRKKCEQKFSLLMQNKCPYLILSFQGYRIWRSYNELLGIEKKKHDRPAGLQIFKKQTPTQVFSCGICEEWWLLQKRRNIWRNRNEKNYCACFIIFKRIDTILKYFGNFTHSRPTLVPQNRQANVRLQHGTLMNCKKVEDCKECRVTTAKSCSANCNIFTLELYGYFFI